MSVVTTREGARLGRALARELRGHRVTEILVRSIADGVQLAVVVPSANQVSQRTVDVVDTFAVEHEDWEWGTCQVVWEEEQREVAPRSLRRSRWPHPPVDPEDPELGATPDPATVDGARELAIQFLTNLQASAGPRAKTWLPTAIGRTRQAQAEQPVDLYRSVFDLGIAIGENPTTSQIVIWADDQVQKLPEAGKDPPSWPWSNDPVQPWSRGYSQLDADPPRPMHWFTRHLAYVFVLEGNEDMPKYSAELLRGAQKLLAAQAFNDSRPAQTSRIMNLMEWVLTDNTVLPAGATWTRTWLVRAAKVAGTPKPPGFWDALLDAGGDLATDIAKIPGELDPPGGLGVYIGGAILIFGGVAAWGLTRKGVPALTRR